MNQDEQKRSAAMQKAWDERRGNNWIVLPPPIDFEKGFDAGLATAQAEIQRLRKALEHYADKYGIIKNL